MSKIFITGSADGLGQMTATLLASEGHDVVLHARNAERAREALRRVPAAKQVLTGDLSNEDETRRLADAANAWGAFDAVIHNAGVYRAPAATIFAVNTLAPYVLTGLLARPKRLIYLSSGMHRQGTAPPEHFAGHVDRITYSDTKLHVLLLSKALARKWPDVYSNSVDPGWVATKMGGPGAPGNLQKGSETQAWLAVSDDPKALTTGGYFHHQRPDRYNRLADDEGLQDRFLTACAEWTGVSV